MLQCTRFKEKASFVNATFHDDASFVNATFHDDASFVNTKFNGKADFNKTYFIQNSLFKYAAFNGPAEFFHSNFSAKADFTGTKFTRSAKFAFAFIKRSALFKNSEFKGIVSFLETEFNSRAEFSNSAFDGVSQNAKDISSNFMGSTFKDDANFDNCTFKDVATFSSSKFCSIANFIKSKFNSPADFKYSMFNEAKFDEAVFNKEIDFSDAQFNSSSFTSCYFKDNALFENTIFKGVLYLTKTKYDRLYIRWSSISKQGKLGYDDTAYLLLIKNFKNLGFFQDAYDCYYQYRLDHLSQTSDLSIFEYISLIFDYAAGGLYGWGVRPQFPVGWSAFLIILFFLIYYCLDLGMDAQKALKFSTMVLLSGAGPFLSISCDLSRAGRYQNLALAEKILGSVLFALFLVALSKTIIGDVI
jgi:hypothetical protein